MVGISAKVAENMLQATRDICTFTESTGSKITANYKYDPFGDECDDELALARLTQ